MKKALTNDSNVKNCTVLGIVCAKAVSDHKSSPSGSWFSIEAHQCPNLRYCAAGEPNIYMRPCSVVLTYTVVMKCTGYTISVDISCDHTYTSCDHTYTMYISLMQNVRAKREQKERKKKKKKKKKEKHRKGTPRLTQV